ncbi:MAG: SDR family oxidoreductase [Chloroflexota bacterium]|nr:SDR family oxidoreductase [Chloroflexota bacterium]
MAGLSARNVLLAAGLGLAGSEVYRRLNLADLHGQVALVTGGSRGLGLLIARELAREGCRVAICARDEAELERARADLEGRGAEVMTVVCDVADRARVEEMVGAITARFGRLDILVNNAGIIQIGPIHNMAIEDFEEAMDVMFWGTVYPTLAVLPQMRARRSGRIVNVTSIGGKISVPHLLPYSCAKFAATAFSEGLSAELSRDGIVVTTICPGLMRTGSFLQAFAKGNQEAEFAWFALSDNLPIISMDAERAARQIVQSTRRGDRVRVLTIPADLGARFHGLFPGVTTALLSMVNQVLPGPTDDLRARARGLEVQERMDSNLLRKATAMGQDAARRFNELSEPRPQRPEVTRDRSASASAAPGTTAPTR